jgi:tetratricopeptide (TPR) repeat protein
MATDPKHLTVIILLCLLVLASGVLTFSVNSIWRTQESLCTALLERNPGHGDILAVKARLISRTLGPAAALELLTQTPLSRNRITGAYLSALGSVLYVMEKWDKAYEVFERVPANSSFASHAVIMQAYIRFNQNQPEEALNLLRSLLETDPGNWDAYVAQGRFYLKAKNWFEAGRSYGEAIDAGRRDEVVLQPFIAAMEHLGDTQAAAGEPAKAKRAYILGMGALERMAKRGHTGLEFQMRQVALMVKAEDVKGALDIFRRLEKRLSDFEINDRRYIRKQFAFFCMRFMLFVKADELFTAIRTEEPDDPDHIFWQATAKFRRRHLAKAEMLFQEAEDLYRAQGNIQGIRLTRQNKGQIDLFVKDYEQAEERFRSIAAEAPDFWQARAGLTEALILQNKFEESGVLIYELERVLPQSYFILIKLKAMLAREQRHELSLARYHH